MIFTILQVIPLLYVWILTIFRYSSLELDNTSEAMRELMISTCFAGCHLLARQLVGRGELKYLSASAIIMVCQYYFAYSLWQQHVYGTEHSYVNLSGKCFIITGSNTGIGYETAKALLKLNGTVILACRSKERAQEARSKLLKETAVAPSKVIVLQLDLCDFQSVREFVEKFKELNLPLNCLVNNAGLISDQRSVCKDGNELTLTANHLGHFLLTNLLMPQLIQSSGRVVNVTSCLHKLVKNVDFDNIMFEKNYDMFPVYGQSKLANILFTKSLARRIEKSNIPIQVFAVHPGCVRTEFTKGMNWFFRLGNALVSPILATLQKTPTQGAFGVTQVAIEPLLTNNRYNGLYFFHGHIAPSSELSRDEEIAEKLWIVSEKLTKSSWTY